MLLLQPPRAGAHTFRVSVGGVGIHDRRASENSLGLLRSFLGTVAGANGFSRNRDTKLQRPETGAGRALLWTSGISLLYFIFSVIFPSFVHN